MNIIRKSRLLPATPTFVGTSLDIRVGEGLVFKICSGKIAEDCDRITVDWGDGSVPEEFAASLNGAAHAYPSPGEYRLGISDDVKSLAVGTVGESSEYTAVYAPMVTGFFSNASRLDSAPAFGFHNCVNLRRFDVSRANLKTIAGAAFKNCSALDGEILLPDVESVVGSSALIPFGGCPRIAALHFAAKNEAAIVAGTSFKSDPTLGTGVEGVCRFDL